MRRILTRPFSTAHWTLLGCLVALWELLPLFWCQCKSLQYYFGTVLATATVCIALWVNHLASIHLQGTQRVWKIVSGAVYDLLTLFLLLIVVALPIVLMPCLTCTDRSRISEAMLFAFSLRTEITEKAISTKSMANSGSGIKVVPEGRVKGGLVTTDGVIVIVTEEPPAVISMTPEYVDGQVYWRCLVYPSKFTPSFCRE